MTYSELIVQVAKSQLGTLEQSAQVNLYLESVSGRKPNAWCYAFIYWCLSESANLLGGNTSALRTLSTIAAWRYAKKHEMAILATLDTPYLIVRPGDIMVRAATIEDANRDLFADTILGVGHCGIVTDLSDSDYRTIEGNAPDSSTSNKDGVILKTHSWTELRTMGWWRPFIAGKKR